MGMFGLQHGRDDVDVVEAHQLAAEEGHRILDVREPDEFAAGHVSGAVHVPLRDLDGRLGQLDRSARWLAMCRSGARSARATALLRRHGFEARNVAGGVTAWARSGLPVQDRSGAPGRVV
jgi:rhodanese-related sulfurtransferase